MEWTIRKGSQDDLEAVFDLYATVSLDDDGIIREPEEITKEYISQFIANALKNGLFLLAQTGEKIIGEIHGYPYQLMALRHCLTDVTIVVHPDYQSLGIGKQLLKTFLKRIEADFTYILRVELYTRAHNVKNTSFYKNFGFIDEGRQESKIMSRNGSLQTPLHMVWMNPGFELKKDIKKP